jgi:Rrf2 family protein
MKISKKTQYGMRVMVYLAKFSKKKKLCCLKKISQDEGIPFSFLEKIIARLVKEGLVGAQKGPGGGYFLAKKPKNIKVGQIVGLLEGVTAPVKCLDKEVKFVCPREKNCLAKKLWSKVKKSLDSTLNLITLADLIKP